MSLLFDISIPTCQVYLILFVSVSLTVSQYLFFSSVCLISPSLSLHFLFVSSSFPFLSSLSLLSRIHLSFLLLLSIEQVVFAHILILYSFFFLPDTSFRIMTDPKDYEPIPYTPLYTHTDTVISFFPHRLQYIITSSNFDPEYLFRIGELNNSVYDGSSDQCYGIRSRNLLSDVGKAQCANMIRYGSWASTLNPLRSLLFFIYFVPSSHQCYPILSAPVISAFVSIAISVCLYAISPSLVFF